MIHKMSRLSFRDNGKPYTFLAETAWIAAADRQGWQRIWYVSILGEYKSPHKMRVDVFYDYKEEIEETKYLDQTMSKKPGQLGSIPKIQKCQAIKLRISDAETSGSEESFSISHLQLEVAVKKGIQHSNRG